MKPAINPECGHSFEHFTKGKSYDDLLVGVDEEFIKIIKDIAVPLVKRFDGGKKMSEALVINSLCLYHLFRIQKESDELEC